MQKHVHYEFSKELPLLLDAKTRWSSRFSMLARFYLICNAIRKALVQLKLQPSIAFTGDEFEHHSQRCASSASSQIDSGGFASTDSRHALRFMLKTLRAKKTALVLIWQMHFPDVVTNVYPNLHIFLPGFFFHFNRPPTLSVVNQISQWMSNLLCLNPTKTEFIIIGLPAQIKKIPDSSIRL